MLTIDLKLDDSAARDLLARAPGAIQDAAMAAIDWALAELERTVKENIASPFAGRSSAVAFGVLLDAVYSEPLPSPALGGIVDVHPPADVYAASVEYGAAPHMPPVEALFGWVQRKLRIEDQQEMKSVAWAVAKTIEKRGTAGFHMFERALAANQDRIVQKLNSEIEQAVEKLNAGELAPI
jgi:hypothetical protein